MAKEESGMSQFIATMVEAARDEGGVEAGKKQYCAYFKGKARQKLYGRYEELTDIILETDGYGDCIVDCSL